MLIKPYFKNLGNIWFGFNFIRYDTLIDIDSNKKKEKWVSNKSHFMDHIIKDGAAWILYHIHQ